jgi:predicted PurR-regulated permease PerM
MDIHTKRRYWLVSLIVILLALGILLFRQLTPILSGMLGAFTIYILVRRQNSWLTRQKHLNRSLAALLITAEAICCFLVPLALLVWVVVSTVKGINLDPQALVAPAQQIIDFIREKTGYDLLGTDTLSFLVSSIPRIGQYVMSGISSFAFNIGMLIIVLYFMLVGGERMERYLSELLPFSDADSKDVVSEVQRIVQSNAIGIPLLAIIQGGIATLGYWAFGVPNLWLAGVLTCFATIIPMVGTALIWLPAAVIMAIGGDWFNAIGLLLFGALIISQLDNLIRFILQKKMADTHPLITIFGVIVGLPLFGFMGIIFGPLLIALFLLCVDIFKREYLSAR